MEKLLKQAKSVAEKVLIKTEAIEKAKPDVGKKRLTRGLARRLRNNNKDAEEGKYFEREISDLEPSYTPTTINSGIQISDDESDGEDGLLITNILPE